MQDAITKEFTIAAPINTVWEVVTKPEHMAKWFFGAKAQLDLRPGGRGSLTWDGLGTAPLEIVTVDKPRRFSFLWVAPDEETASTHQQTLVEFTLQEDGSKTQLRLTESGFAQLQISDSDKNSLIDKHTDGWSNFGAALQQHAESL